MSPAHSVCTCSAMARKCKCVQWFPSALRSLSLTTAPLPASGEPRASLLLHTVIGYSPCPPKGASTFRRYFGRFSQGSALSGFPWTYPGSSLSLSLTESALCHLSSAHSSFSQERPSPLRHVIGWNILTSTITRLPPNTLFFS